MSVLTASQRAAWDTYAANVSWIDTLGQTIQLSGINMYVRSNTPRLFADAQLAPVAPLGRIDDAPVIFDVGLAPIVSAVTPTHVTGPPETVGLTVAWSNDAEYASTDNVLIYVSPPLNPSVKFWKGPYFLVDLRAGDDGSVPAALFSSAAVNRYESRFGPITTGQAVHFALRAAMTDGRLSSQVRGGPALIPAAA